MFTLLWLYARTISQGEQFIAEEFNESAYLIQFLRNVCISSSITPTWKPMISDYFHDEFGRRKLSIKSYRGFWISLAAIL